LGTGTAEATDLRKPEIFATKEWRLLDMLKCFLKMLFGEFSQGNKPFENIVLLFEGGSSEKNIHVRKVILKKWVERFLDLEKLG